MEAEGEIAQRQHKEGGRGKIQLGDFVVRIERPLRERKKKLEKRNEHWWRLEVPFLIRIK